MEIALTMVLGMAVGFWGGCLLFDGLNGFQKN